MRPCETEIADTQWYSVYAWPQLPSPISISRKLIDATATEDAVGERVVRAVDHLFADRPRLAGEPNRPVVRSTR